MALQSVGIIGAGAWGTALAVTAKRAGRDVTIWAYEPETLADLTQNHRNEAYLPGVSLDPAIRATGRLSEVADRDFLLLATPAQHARAIAGELAPHLKRERPLVICSSASSRRRASSSRRSWPRPRPRPRSPCCRGRVSPPRSRGLPAAVTLATAEEALRRALSYALSHAPFRCYWSDDLLGAEIGGAVKNVYAIAAGIVAGKKLGASAHAALVTRGFAEMARLGTALGARLETLAGLSGLGDLVLTCGGAQSRNMSLGLALGKGESLDDVLGQRLGVTEGVYTASALVAMAAAYRIDMPIAQAVHAVISGRATVDAAIGALLARPLRAEAE